VDYTGGSNKPFNPQSKLAWNQEFPAPFIQRVSQHDNIDTTENLVVELMIEKHKLFLKTTLLVNFTGKPHTN
jgi:hypothetical protein